MSVAAVSTVRNEVDIIEATVSHLLEEGIERVYIADGLSTDGTREILDDLSLMAPITVITDGEPYHYQPKWVDRLAHLAASEGHDWIIPFDADEFWYANTDTRISEALRVIPPDVGVLTARMFQHADWDHRHIEPQPFPKVAYRWCETARIANGNHSIQGVPGEVWPGILDIRELKYRSYEHFKRKIIERNATLDPSLPKTDGWHMRVLDGLPESELRHAWDSMQEVPAVVSPVPSSFRPSTLGRLPNSA